MKRIAFVGLCVLLVCTIFAGQEYSLTDLRISAMKDIYKITSALTEYSLAGKTYPVQKGAFTEESPIYKELDPKGTGWLPTMDPWGNPYYVFLGEDIRGVYGIQDNEPDDCLVASFGRDGKPDDWLYDPNDSGGTYAYDAPAADNDIVWYSGTLIRGPEDGDNSGAGRRASGAPARTEPAHRPRYTTILIGKLASAPFPNWSAMLAHNEGPVPDSGLPAERGIRTTRPSDNRTYEP